VFVSVYLYTQPWALAIASRHMNLSGYPNAIPRFGQSLATFRDTHPSPPHSTSVDRFRGTPPVCWPPADIRRAGPHRLRNPVGGAVARAALAERNGGEQIQ